MIRRTRKFGIAAMRAISTEGACVSAKSARSAGRDRASARRIALCSLAFVALAAPSAAEKLSYLAINAPYKTQITSPKTYTLPGYGKVEVSWAAAPQSGLPTFDHEEYSPVTGKIGNYSWDGKGTAIHMFSSSTSSYIVTYTFQDGQPDLSRLVLSVNGFESGTTAAVSETVSLAGELDIPIPTSTTTSTTMLGLDDKTISSANNADPKNTGWALFTVSSDKLPGAKPTLTLTFKHSAGDGIGTTLGYVQRDVPCCIPLTKPALQAMLTPVFKPNSTPKLYRLKMQPMPGFQNTAFSKQMQAYLMLVNATDPSITSVSIDIAIYDSCKNTYGSPGACPPSTTNIFGYEPVDTQTITWTVNQPPVVPSGIFSFTAATMKQNNGYIIGTGVKFNSGATLPPDCHKWVGYWENHQVVTPRLGAGAPAPASRRVIEDVDGQATSAIKNRMTGTQGGKPRK
jgi:hypothetical protein